MATGSDTVLSVQAACLQRSGKAVLRGVDLTIPGAAVTALVGTNGAGKSSLVLAIAGEIALASGRITLGTRDLQGLRPERVRASGVAVVPQGHRVLGGLSVRDNLRVAASLLPQQRVGAAIDAVLAIFPELQSKLAVGASALSGGQKQMLCIAQALLLQPRFLVLDELSLGLAPLVVKRLVEVVVAVSRQGTGVLLIEQFTTLALAISSQAYVMVRGRIAWAGASADLARQPEILHSSYLA